MLDQVKELRVNLQYYRINSLHYSLMLQALLSCHFSQYTQFDDSSHIAPHLKYAIKMLLLHADEEYFDGYATGRRMRQQIINL